MATGKISGNALTSSTIARDSTTSSYGGTLEQFQCYKVGNVVCVGARVYGLNNSGATANKYYFQLPDGFRPRVATYAFGSLLFSGATSPVPATIRIETSGAVGTSYGSAVITQIAFSAVFPI